MQLIEFLRGRAHVRARGVALIVASSLFMIFLDAAIMNTSLPQMAHSFGVSSVEVDAGIVAYLLAVAAAMPVSGWLSDRFGAKPVFAMAIALFTLASIGCGAANSLPTFVVARILQGVGGALMMSIGRVIVLRNAEKQEIMQAVALISWPALIAPVIGPALGGAITTWAHWRWNFLLNVPLGLLGVLLVLAYVPDHREAGRKPLDIPGCILTSASLILLLYALEELAKPGRAMGALGLLLLAAILGVLAVGWLLRARYPLLDLAPFKIATFSVANLDAGMLQRLAMSATPFLLPLLLQLVWRFDPLQAGLVVLIYFAGNLVMKTVTTPMLRWFGFRTVLVVNGLLVAASVAACGLLTATTPILLTAAVVFGAGACRSMQFTALNTLTFADMPAERRTSAATLSNMLQQIGLALGVAAGALFLHLSQVLHGTSGLTAGDFRFAFLATGLCGLVGALLTIRLHPDAGWEVSGRPPKTSRSR